MTPIGILSFNRPDYLKDTLLSLAGQAGNVLENREIHLFQDGCINPISRKQYMPADIADKNVEIFTSIFPQGVVHYQPENLGIAKHFDFIERFFFEKREFEAAIFLEDDMVLSPHYIEIMEKMISVSKQNDKIGYVAAYGNHRAPLSEQLGRVGDVVEMHHKWGFALMRRQWLRQRPMVQEYLDFISDMDYNSRSEARIIEWLLSKNILPTGTSQDGFKDAAMSLTGATKLMTYCCYGKYIGKVGVHSNELLYDKMGFGRTELCPELPAVLNWPSEDELDRMIAARSRAFRDNVTKIEKLFPSFKRSSEPQAIVAAAPIDTHKELIAEDIRDALVVPLAHALYQVFFFREPDPGGLESVKRQLSAGKSIADIMRWALRSTEFGTHHRRFLDAYVSQRFRPAKQDAKASNAEVKETD